MWTPKGSFVLTPGEIVVPGIELFWLNAIFGKLTFNRLIDCCGPTPNQHDYSYICAIKLPFLILNFI